ncbi:MAG: MFS transporter [Actinobacteria bacterium]|nr:MFS transporter [Actinomycetota bacterium]MBL7123977.1 MFS transporter [Actinomycetota bacterium]
MMRNALKDNIRTLFRPPVISWALYDLANTSFAVVIITIIFPVYFTSIIVSPEIYSQNFGDLMWGIASGVSMIIVSFLAPIFGAIADTSRSKNKFLTFLTLACIFFSFLLFFLKEGMVTLAVILFIICNVFYQTSMEFYNSFLPQLSSKKNTGIISGFGFSAGYLGGLLILILIYPFVRGGLVPSNLSNIRITFLITCIFFLIFSLPSFILLKDSPAVKPVKISTSYISYGFKKLANTLKNIKKRMNLTKFLISYFLFCNAFSILALYAAIYAKNTLGFGLLEITILFILGHIPTIISSFFFGWLTDKIGPKVTITITLIMWIIIILLITAFINIRAVFYICWILAAISTGSTLIASRSLMTFLIPRDSEAEFFGFYSISGKVSAIIGPTAFGVISFITKSQRIALLSTLFFLIGGLVVLQFVKVPTYRLRNF